MQEQWEVGFLNDAVEAEFETLPKDARTKIAHIIDVIETKGLEHLREPYIKHVQDKLWEIIGKSGRALYVTVTRKRVTILRCFVKKTNQTPQTEIKLAIARMKEAK